MNFISVLHQSMERSSAGSEETALAVLDMCGDAAPKNTLFFGDDCATPRLIGKRYSCNLTAAYAEDFRAEAAARLGISCVPVRQFELPKLEGGYGLVWYNGTVEFDGIAQRISQLRDVCGKNAVIVYRTLCWLTEPSPDTRVFCGRRFGVIQPLDAVLVTLKEQGCRISDFYISPKTDWTEHYYKPLMAAAKEYAGVHPQDSLVTAGMSELKKEMDVFEMHCEEYSYVYYVMKG